MQKIWNSRFIHSNTLLYANTYRNDTSVFVRCCMCFTDSIFIRYWNCRDSDTDISYSHNSRRLCISMCSRIYILFKEKERKVLGEQLFNFLQQTTEKFGQKKPLFSAYVVSETIVSSVFCPYSAITSSTLCSFSSEGSDSTVGSLPC